jgi:hypothetical protein
MKNRAPRHWTCFFLGLFVLSIGIYAQMSCKIILDKHAAQLKSENYDFANGRLSLSGFEAFERKYKHDQEDSVHSWWVFTAVGCFLVGIGMMLYGLTRKKIDNDDIDRAACPECGELIAVTARVCRFCNAMIRPQERPRRRFNQ